MEDKDWSIEMEKCRDPWYFFKNHTTAGKNSIINERDFRACYKAMCSTIEKEFKKVAEEINTTTKTYMPDGKGE